MMQTKCPNCGAIITGGKCEYCDTVFTEDKLSLDTTVYFDRPFQLTVPLKNGDTATFNVVVTDMNMVFVPDQLATIDVQLTVLDRFL